MKYLYRGQNNKNSIVSGIDKTKVLLAIILALVIVICILLYPMLFSKTSYNKNALKLNIASAINSEYKKAVSASEELSRSATSGSSNILSRVRQHVYAMNVLNQYSISSFGNSSRMIPEQNLTNVQNVIEAFMNQLQTGKPLGEILQKLTDSLSELKDSIVSVE